MLSYVAQVGHGFSILFYASLGEVSAPFSSFATGQNEAFFLSICPDPEISSVHLPFRNSCPTHGDRDSIFFFTNCCTSTVWFRLVISFTRFLNFVIALSDGTIHFPGLNSCPRNSKDSLLLLTIFVFSG